MSREKKQAYPPRKSKTYAVDQAANDAVLNGLGKAAIVGMMLVDKDCQLITIMTCFRNPTVLIIPSEQVKRDFEWGVRKTAKVNGRRISFKTTNYHGVEIEWRDDQ